MNIEFSGIIGWLFTAIILSSACCIMVLGGFVLWSYFIFDVLFRSTRTYFKGWRRFLQFITQYKSFKKYREARSKWEQHSYNRFRKMMSGDPVESALSYGTQNLTTQELTDFVNGLIKDKEVWVGKVSDGYHTFDELYEHRITLYIALLRVYNKTAFPKLIWKTKKHSDGEVWDGWFLLGVGTEPGEQITYHLPNEYWDQIDFAKGIERAPEWDGHTSNEVLERLQTFYTTAD